MKHRIPEKPKEKYAVFPFTVWIPRGLFGSVYLRNELNRERKDDVG